MRSLPRRPRPERKLFEATNANGIGFLERGSDHEHAPTLVVRRVDTVDLERDSVAVRGVQLGAVIGTKDNLSAVERVVDGKDQGLTVDHDGQSPEVVLLKETRALVGPEHDEARARVHHGRDSSTCSASRSAPSIEVVPHSASVTAGKSTRPSGRPWSMTTTARRPVAIMIAATSW